jgi:hypothetical protein
MAADAIAGRVNTPVFALKYIVRIADTMLGQLSQGMHENPALLVGLNPPRRLRRNPLSREDVVAEEQISDRVYQVKYRHLEDGEDYQHPFAAGVELWTVTMGKARCVVLAGKDGQDLWQDF